MVETNAAVRRLITRNHWFISLRWLAAVAIVAATAGTQWLFDIRLKAGPLYGIAGLLLFYNLVFLFVARRLERRPPEDVTWREVNRFANTQISVDLVVLTLLLHFSGGVENPLAYFFVFHMIIASILLSPLASYLQATLAVMLYAAMALVEWTWPGWHHCVQGFIQEELSANGKYVLASVGALSVTLYLTVFLSVSIARQLRRRELELEEANRKLAELEERKSRFMRVAAHQLRAPLGAITSSLKVVVEGYVRNDPAKERDLLQRAIHRTQAMLTLLNDLLALSRARESRMEQKEGQVFSLGEVVEKQVALHRPRAEEKAIRLELRLTSQPDRIRADRSAIEDVVGNLLSNAIKYTPKGGHVTVRSEVREGFVFCSVTDTGIGIPANELKDLFAEFYRASNAKDMEQEGTGLGLSIVKEIVTRHGGDVWVQSELNKGSTFTFKLPAANA